MGALYNILGPKIANRLVFVEEYLGPTCSEDGASPLPDAEQSARAAVYDLNHVLDVGRLDPEWSIMW